MIALARPVITSSQARIMINVGLMDWHGGMPSSCAWLVVVDMGMAVGSCIPIGTVSSAHLHTTDNMCCCRFAVARPPTNMGLKASKPSELPAAPPQASQPSELPAAPPQASHPKRQPTVALASQPKKKQHVALPGRCLACSWLGCVWSLNARLSAVIMPVIVRPVLC